jgi:hypothetical protein
MATADKSSRLPRLVAASKGVLAERGLQARFAELLEQVQQNRPGEDLAQLKRAFAFAAEKHQTQVRESGDPYLSHPLEVAHILAELRLDMTTLCAALLHDVVEDARNQPPGSCLSRSAAGGERSQDAAGHGDRRARGAGEIG